MCGWACARKRGSVTEFAQELRRGTFQVEQQNRPSRSYGPCSPTWAVVGSQVIDRGAQDGLYADVGQAMRTLRKPAHRGPSGYSQLSQRRFHQRDDSGRPYTKRIILASATELLTYRADRDRYHYCADKLYNRHPEIVVRKVLSECSRRPYHESCKSVVPARAELCSCTR